MQTRTLRWPLTYTGSVCSPRHLTQMCYGKRYSTSWSRLVTVTYFLSWRTMLQIRGQRLMISTPCPCHHQGELSSRQPKRCNQSHRDLRLKNSLTLLGQRAFYHGTVQRCCLPSSLPPLGAVHHQCLADRWTPAATCGHSLSKHHPLHLWTRTNRPRLLPGSMMSC